MSDSTGWIVGAVGAGTGVLAFVGGRWDARRSAKDKARDQLRLDIADLERKVAKVEAERDVVIDRMRVMEKSLRDAERLNDLLAGSVGGGPPPVGG